MGTRLGEIIAPFADAFQAECIVFGGQISKSFDLFESELQKSLSNITSLKKITKALYPDKSALYGAAQLIFNKELK
jgi:glucokinase